MTKTELAEKAGISRGIIIRMGKNDLVTLDAIVKICNALDCDVIDCELPSRVTLADFQTTKKLANPHKY